MTLNEALKTGLPFKRPTWEYWACVGYYGRIQWAHSGKPVFVYAEDVHATDYEIAHSEKSRDLGERCNDKIH